MAVKRILSHSLSALGSFLGSLSSIWEFTGEIVPLAPSIVRTLFKKVKEYLAEDIGNRPHEQTEYDDAASYCVGQWQIWDHFFCKHVSLVVI